MVQKVEKRRSETIPELIAAIQQRNGIQPGYSRDTAGIQPGTNLVTENAQAEPTAENEGTYPTSENTLPTSSLENAQSTPNPEAATNPIMETANVNPDVGSADDFKTSPKYHPGEFEKAEQAARRIGYTPVSPVYTPGDASPMPPLSPLPPGYSPPAPGFIPNVNICLSPDYIEAMSTPMETRERQNLMPTERTAGPAPGSVFGSTECEDAGGNANRGTSNERQRSITINLTITMNVTFP